MLRKVFFKTLLALVWLLTSPSHSFASVPSAYQRVALEEAVPEKILFAVALVESRNRWGRKSLPWPWTLNVKGKPMFFRTRQEAEAKLLSEVMKGNESIAIGIMQIYWKHHKDKFLRPTQLLDPMTNLRYGARYLRQQYVTEGDWYLAIGQYHSGSKTPEGMKRANQYADWVMTQWKRL